MRGLITRGFLARLYPNRVTAERLHQWAGAQRFLWNRLLAAEKAEYARTGKFIWKRELQPMAVAEAASPGAAGIVPPQEGIGPSACECASCGRNPSQGAGTP